MKTRIKSYRFIIVIVLMVCVGWFIFSQIHHNSKKRLITKEIQKKGESLISLIAMYRIEDLEGEDRNFFLRILSEYIVKEGLAYCTIHDNDETPVISFVPGDIEYRIPPDVKIRSLFSKGMMVQRYTLAKSGTTIYEFAKPLFDKGKIKGVVRLGMNLPDVDLYTLENLSITALAVFLGIAILTLGYYEVLSTLKTVRGFGADSGLAPEDTVNPGEDDHISQTILSIENLLGRFEKKRQMAEAENLELKSRISAILYEKKQMHKILDSIDFGIMIMDSRDMVLFINNYALFLFGKKCEGTHSITGCSLNELTENQVVKNLIIKHNTMGQGNSENPVEMTFPMQAPGQVFHLSLADLKDAQGAPVGKKLFITNITREKKSEQAKEDFIAHISHELMTPLTNIKSYTEMLVDNEIRDRETQKEFYNTINQETDRLATLIRNILNLSQMESGKIQIKKGLLKTDWLVKSCLNAIEASAHAKGIAVETDMPDNFPTLIADKTMIKAALINVMGNALKYSPENSRITFSIRETDSMVVFDIIDSGFGISETDLPHIFNKFYRSENEKIIEQAGSGLGLAITQEIINIHRGEIDVLSEPGKGSHFSLKLPREGYYIAGN